MTTTGTRAWTDPRGIVHISVLGQRRTLCGMESTRSSATTPTDTCDECVTASIQEYARNHVCGQDCHMSERDKTAAGLDQRVPQASEAAQLDRRLSWSGQIVTKAEPCRDLEFIARVHDRLHHL